MTSKNKFKGSLSSTERSISIDSPNSKVIIIDRIDEQWIKGVQNKYKAFNVRNFIDNFANEIFNHYHGIFNVFAFLQNDNEPEVNAQIIPDAVQIVKTKFGGKMFVVFVFRAGFFCLSKQLSNNPWRAMGEYYRNTNDKQETEIDFIFKI